MIAKWAGSYTCDLQIELALIYISQHLSPTIKSREVFCFQNKVSPISSLERGSWGWEIILAKKGLDTLKNGMNTNLHNKNLKNFTNNAFHKLTKSSGSPKLTIPHLSKFSKQNKRQNPLAETYPKGLHYKINHICLQ